jgi:soluble lytic murein transglycosylase-like protein
MKTYSLAAKIGLIGILTIPLRLYFKSEEIKEPQHNVNHGSVDLNAPTAVKMFNAIEFYAKKYDIPIKYALGVAYVETRYQGPFHWRYNPVQKSSAGALGPMQIMPSTANSVWQKQISRSDLASNIDLNVETSMKVLRRLYDRYGNWKLVFGCYNTGRPCVNGYAEKVYNFNPKIK